MRIGNGVDRGFDSGESESTVFVYKIIIWGLYWVLYILYHS